MSLISLYIISAFARSPSSHGASSVGICYRLVCECGIMYKAKYSPTSTGVKHLFGEQARWPVARHVIPTFPVIREAGQICEIGHATIDHHGSLWWLLTSSATARATCMPSRVLPQPPVPVSVTRREAESRRATSALSYSRPMKLLT
jgi:hypothetical protein